MKSLPVRGDLVLVTLYRSGKDGVTTTQDIRRFLDPRRGEDDTEYGTLSRDELTGDWAYTFRKLDEMGMIDRDMDVTTENGGQGAPHVSLTKEGERYAESMIEAKRWDIKITEADETLESLGTDLSALYRRVGEMEARLDRVEEQINEDKSEKIDSDALDDLRMRLEQVSDSVNEVHGRIDEVSASVDEVHGRVDKVSASVDEVQERVKRIDDRSDHTERLALGTLKMVEENIEGRYGFCLDCNEWSELATMNGRREGFCLDHALEGRYLELDQSGEQIIPDHHSES